MTNGTGWTAIDRDQVDGWNSRLLQTRASYRQYPYWNEPYRHEGCTPNYLVYGGEEHPSAYACVVTRRVAMIKIGLVQCGPVSLSLEQGLERNAIHRLADWAIAHGHSFLRFTHSDDEILRQLVDTGRTEPAESFPFHRDPRNKMLVKQVHSDDEMRSSFQSVARYEIRAALRAGWEIRSSDDPNALVAVWPLFEALAKRKGFELSNRSLSGWLEVFRAAQRHGCARLYGAYLNGECIQSILVIRYGQVAEYMLGALDIERLNRRASPSCLIHWQAMRDFYREGCALYNLGGPGSVDQVYQFKRKFHPLLSVNPEPVTMVLRPALYQLWSSLVLKTLLPCRSRARRFVSRLRPENRQHSIA
jgi:lipid II:glycine glycyltransferase (peptidoglycan interpeptide bridge formation enzyme)